jgi:hypothetical protein
MLLGRHVEERRAHLHGLRGQKQRALTRAQEASSSFPDVCTYPTGADAANAPSRLAALLDGSFDGSLWAKA